MNNFYNFCHAHAATKTMTSILFALLVIVSVNAAPVKTKVFSTEGKNVELVKKSVNELSKTVYQDFRAAAQKKAAMKAVSPAFAPKAVQAETVNINFTTPYSAEYYSSSKDWYIVAQDDDYTVVLDIFSNDGTALPAGTYETSAFDLTYTYVKDKAVSTSTKIYATSASATVTVDGDRTDIAAVLNCTDGKTYNITMSYTKKDPEVYNVTIVSCTYEYYSADKDVYYLLSVDDKTQFGFDIYLTGGLSDAEKDKTYTLDDMEPYYSYGAYEGVAVNYASASFTKTSDENGMDKVVAVIVDTKGNTYNLTYVEQPATPNGEVKQLYLDTTMNAPFHYDDGSWEISAQHGDTTIVMTYFSSNATSCAGTFTNKDFDRSNTGVILDSTVLASTASATVVENADNIKVTGEILGTNGVVYKIELNYVKPKALSKETITSEALAIDLNYYTTYGVILFEGSDANDTINLTLNAKGLDAAMAGNYVIGTDGNGTVTPVAGAESNIYSGTVTIAVATNGDVTMTGSVLCENNVEYTLNLKYIKPEAVKHDITVGECTNTYNSSTKSIQYTLTSDDGDYKFFFRIYLEEGQEDVVSGKTYDFATDMQANTNYSFGMLTDGSYTYFDYASATFTKTVNGKVTTIIANVVDLEGNIWNFSYEHTALDALTFTFQRTDDGIVVTPSNETTPWDFDYVTPSTLGTFSAEDYAQAILSYYGGESAAPGAYELSIEEDLGLTEAGNYVLIVYGVDGSQTAGVATFAFEVKDTATSIDTIEVSDAAVKRIENNQLVIIKNNKKVNVLGQSIR